MHQHVRDAKYVGDGARVLTACATKCREHVPRDVVAPLYRDLLDRVRHVRHRDVEEPGSHLLAAAPVAGGRLDPFRQRGEVLPGYPGVERLVAMLAEHAREVAGLYAPEHDVGIGDRERAAAAVGGWARVGAG